MCTLAVCWFATHSSLAFMTLLSLPTTNSCSTLGMFAAACSCNTLTMWERHPCACVPTYVHACMHMHACMHACVCACVRVCVCACMRACMRVRACVACVRHACMCVCMRCVRSTNIHTQAESMCVPRHTEVHIHIYTYTH